MEEMGITDSICWIPALTAQMLLSMKTVGRHFPVLLHKLQASIFFSPNLL